MIVSTIETGHNFWTRQEVELVGSRFHEYLLSIRHRGCFMAIASNYQTFISSIVSAAGRTDLTSLPEEWLKARLDESRSTSLSYTRRSAGLPYLILAIVNSTTYTDPALLDLATASLFEIADEHKTPMNKDAVVNTAVHAINTLRMMFLETQIGIQMLMHAEKGFSLAINSFRSPYWPIRNAALLLYSALIQRVFSSRNRKSEAGITHKWSGRLSRTDFFQAYPSLEPLLLQELRHSVESGSLHATNTADQSSLFAVLLLLSKLATPVRLPEESFADDELLLSVRQCFGSRVWKVRFHAISYLHESHEASV